MAEFRKKFCENFRLYHLGNFSGVDKGGTKMTELRKFCAKPPSLSCPLKNFLVPIKRILNWLSCEKISVKKLRLYPLEKMFACLQRGAKMTELRKLSEKTPSLSSPFEKNFSCRYRRS